jgi:hypothetical protein
MSNNNFYIPALGKYESISKILVLNFRDIFYIYYHATIKSDIDLSYYYLLTGNQDYCITSNSYKNINLPSLYVKN